MLAESTTAARWNDLNAAPRHMLNHPSEHVVRFLSGLNLARPGHDPYWGEALDIGCGHGRHLRLLRNTGWKAEGVDLFQAVSSSNIQIGKMTALPFEDGRFALVLAYGVFYYATMGDADQAVHEMHRVMAPGAHGFVSVRSSRDWRADHTDSEGVFHLDGHPEDGMLLDFISEAELHEVYGGLFSGVRYELAEFTTHDRDRLNSDWLITVRR